MARLPFHDTLSYKHSCINADTLMVSLLVSEHNWILTMELPAHLQWHCNSERTWWFRFLCGFHGANPS